MINVEYYKTVKLAKELLQTLKCVNIALSENVTNDEYQELYSVKLDIELALEL